MTRTNKKYRWNKKKCFVNLSAGIGLIGTYIWVLWLIAEKPMW